MKEIVGKIYCDFVGPVEIRINNVNQHIKFQNSFEFLKSGTEASGIFFILNWSNLERIISFEGISEII